MPVNIAHSYVGCNRVAHSIDWSEHGLLAYTAQQTVAICNAEVGVRLACISLIGSP